MKDTYNIAVESLEYTSSDKEFYSILTRLRNISLLIPSGHYSTETHFKNSNSMRKSLGNKEQKHYEVPHFLTIQPDFLHDMLDVSFGNYF
ncbi:MAG: hypothetical protein GY870_09440 [archaeon]|nr:hypothetical protein [archaeon]